MPACFTDVLAQYWDTVLSLWILFLLSGIETVFVSGIEAEFVEVQPSQKSNLEREI